MAFGRLGQPLGVFGMVLHRHRGEILHGVLLWIAQRFEHSGPDQERNGVAMKVECLGCPLKSQAGDGVFPMVKEISLLIVHAFHSGSGGNARF